MLVTKGIKAELKPNLSQRKWLNQQFGNIRFIWNHYLSKLQAKWQRARLYKDARKSVPKPLRFPKKYDLYNSLKTLKHKLKCLEYSDSRSLQSYTELISGCLSTCAVLLNLSQRNIVNSLIQLQVFPINLK